jgi:integrase
MKKHQVDLENVVVWIPDSKTPNGIGEVPLTSIAVATFRNQMAIAGEGSFLFPSELNTAGHLKTIKCVWQKCLRRAKVPYFRLYDLRSAYATRLSAGGVVDECLFWSMHRTVMTVTLAHWPHHSTHAEGVLSRENAMFVPKPNTRPR